MAYYQLVPLDPRYMARCFSLSDAPIELCNECIIEVVTGKAPLVIKYDSDDPDEVIIPAKGKDDGV